MRQPMRELIDLACTYLALILGFAAVWLGIYRGWGLEATLVRALICGVAALLLGSAAKLVWTLATFFGTFGKGNRGREGHAREAGEEEGG